MVTKDKAFLDWYTSNGYWGNEDFKQGCKRAWDAALAQPPEPRNFCPRCGKRLGGDVNYIHTCTPPRGL